MPGPTYGLSKKKGEIKRARKIVRKTGATPAAASQQVSSSRPRTIESYPSGTRRRIQKRLRQRTSAQSILDAIGPQIPDGLSKSQFKVLNTIVKTGNEMGATPKEILSAVETGLVESNLQNLPGGDGTSVGWRQEIDSYGSQAERMNVKAGAQRYFSETKDFGRGAGMTAGELAANVQRPREDLRGKYAEREAEARQILSGMRPDTPEAKAARKKLRAATKDLEGLGILKIKGKKNKPATIVRIGRIAQNRFGLTVSENAAFDNGVTPTGGHATNSFHYSNAAIDVTGPSDKLMAFDEFVAKKYGKDLEELYYDPGVNIDNGQLTGPIGGHGTHVHVAETTGASSGIAGAVPSGASVLASGSVAGSGSTKRPLTGAEKRIKRRRNRVLSGQVVPYDSPIPTIDVGSVKVPKIDL